MNIAAFNTSPRKNGNSAVMLQEFLKGAGEAGAHVDLLDTAKLTIQPCRGCLRCNVIGRCAVLEDDWPMVAAAIRAADCLVFASPVYFHHVTAPLKLLLDRFRSFIQVRIAETGLVHRPWEMWRKTFMLLLSMGSPDPAEAGPIVDLFTFMTKIMGPDNRLITVFGTRLAAAGQIRMNAGELQKLYRKYELPDHLAERDAQKNAELLKRCYQLGRSLAESAEPLLTTEANVL